MLIVICPPLPVIAPVSFLLSPFSQTVVPTKDFIPCSLFLVSLRFALILQNSVIVNENIITTFKLCVRIPQYNFYPWSLSICLLSPAPPLKKNCQLPMYRLQYTSYEWKLTYSSRQLKEEVCTIRQNHISLRENEQVPRGHIRCDHSSYHQK